LHRSSNSSGISSSTVSRRNGLRIFAQVRLGTKMTAAAATFSRLNGLGLDIFAQMRP
jgi:hypothetical protein